jgi:hypothetical protein
MKDIILFFCMVLSLIVAQAQQAPHAITNLVVWKPLAGHEDKFEAGSCRQSRKCFSVWRSKKCLQGTDNNNCYATSETLLYRSDMSLFPD